MKKEELHFEILISGTFHQKVPEYSIYLDNTLIERSSIEANSGEVETLEFTSPVSEGDHTLKIRLENKEPTDTIKDDSNTSCEIYKDMLLNIEDIKIDDVSVGNLLWNAKYILDEPQEYQGKIVTQLEKCVNLGWNGSYEFKFTSPFYIWLLENL
jgi:hypothetical protein